MFEEPVSLVMALDRESFLPDAEDCAETWRRMRWNEGLYCPECGSEQVQTRQQNYRDHLHRYHCEACGKWFIEGAPQAGEERAALKLHDPADPNVPPSDHDVEDDEKLP